MIMKKKKKMTMITTKMETVHLNFVDIFHVFALYIQFMEWVWEPDYWHILLIEFIVALLLILSRNLRMLNCPSRYNYINFFQLYISIIKYQLHRYNFRHIFITLFSFNFVQIISITFLSFNFDKYPFIYFIILW